MTSFTFWNVEREKKKQFNHNDFIVVLRFHGLDMFDFVSNFKWISIELAIDEAIYDDD